MTDLPRADEISTREVVLDRMKIAGAGSVSQELLREEWAPDMIADHVALRLSTEVLAERVLDTDTEVECTGRAEVRISQPWVAGLTIAFAYALAISSGLLGYAVLPGMFALMIVYVALVVVENKTHDVRVKGTATVPATYWRKFPEANVRLPDSLGHAVVFQALDIPYWTQDQ